MLSAASGEEMHARLGAIPKPTSKLTMLAETGLQGSIRSSTQDAGTLRDRQLYLSHDARRGPLRGLQESLQAPSGWNVEPSPGFKLSSYARTGFVHASDPAPQTLQRAVSSHASSEAPIAPPRLVQWRLDGDKDEASENGNCRIDPSALSIDVASNEEGTLQREKCCCRESYL